MGPNEPYWQTNSSFSPPLSRRWDQRFQSGLFYGSHGGVQLYGSSLSSHSKESRSWLRSDQFPNHHYSASDGGVSYFSSPSDSFQTQQWTPPLQELVPEHLSFPRSTEGSSSSRSDASEGEHMSKTHVPSHRNFSSRCSFMSKPIHPLSFPNQTLQVEEAHGSVATSGNRATPNEHNSINSSLNSTRPLAEHQPVPSFTEIGTTSQREGSRWSSASSVDLTEMSEQFDPETFGFSYNLSEGSKCGLCERFLSQRSPWSSRRIIKSGDMPIAGVLSCCHVFHADCLEQTTPKMQKHDPPCPLCAKLDEETVPEHQVVCRLSNSFPRLKSVGEDGGAASSRAWSCGQLGDCVEGTLQAPPRNSMLLLSRSRLKKHLSAKGNAGKDLPDSGMLRKNGACSSQLFSGRRSMDQGAVGCSRKSSGPALKRW